MILALLAFLAATLGAISGLGGGIFIMPILVQTYGHDYSASGLAGLSLSIVLLNALTALILGKQIRNVDFTYARGMAMVSSLGVLIGIYFQTQVSRQTFETYLAIFLLVLGIYIFARAGSADKDVKPVHDGFKPVDGVFSFIVGGLASFFGVGGGVLQVPYMVYFRKRMVKQATATSQVILATVAVVSLFLILGVERSRVPWEALLIMAPAVLAGGVVGSRLGRKMRGPWIVRILSLVLLFLAYRVAMS
jgi:uncharacterized protein